MKQWLNDDGNINLKMMQNAKQFFDQYTYYVDDLFLCQSACSGLLSDIKQKQTEQVLPHVKRTIKGRSLDYRVMDGLFVKTHLPALIALTPKVMRAANKLCDYELYPIDNPSAVVNVNITAKGGEYRWHYDRNAITAILYLNQVQQGETELIPNSRFHLGPLKHSCVQRWVDRRLIGKLNHTSNHALNHTRHQTNAVPGIVQVSPKPGRLMIMQGDRCLHSVNPVGSNIERYNVIYTFDKKGARYPIDKHLDPYLYSLEKAPVFDPNYSA